MDCRICGHGGPHGRYTAREMMFGTRDAFPYFACGGCGCLQIEEIPKDLGRYYPQGYYSYDEIQERGLITKVKNKLLGVRERAYVEDRRLMRAVFDKVVAPVEHTRLVLDALQRAGARPSWRILDVGCGSATILHRLRSAGFGGLVGVDPFMGATRVYANGLKVVKAELAQMEAGWDLVTFHHSLEHVPDPIAELRTAKAKLAPGGRVLLRVPTVSSEVWDRYKTDWVQLDAPRHLFLFSRASLEVLAKAAGLVVRWSYDDSTARQFYGSELFKADIALNEPRSYMKNPEGSIFTPAQIESYRREAEALNRAGRGDQVVVLLGVA